MIRIGNAPVSYGAFEVTVGIREGVPGAPQVLDAVQAAGYDGIDLGPLGYLGLGDGLKEALGSRGLLLTGGYVEIDVSADDAPEPGLAELAQVCDQFDALGAGVSPEFLPRPTVAIIGSPPAAAGETADRRWARIERTVGELTEQCRKRGYQAVLHNEVGTQLATQAEVVRVLESTAAALCLDTGHLVAAGAGRAAVHRCHAAVGGRRVLPAGGGPRPGGRDPGRAAGGRVRRLDRRRAGRAAARPGRLPAGQCAAAGQPRLPPPARLVAGMPMTGTRA
jgi:sugar phosphate isomerase/epimerase